MVEPPAGSPQKESALTVAKLLSGEDPAATEGKPADDKVAPAVVTLSVAAAGGGGGGVGSKRWLFDGVPEKVRRAEIRRAELGFRASAAVFCLVSLSVMAADTTPGRGKDWVLRGDWVGFLKRGRGRRNGARGGDGAGRPAGGLRLDRCGGAIRGAHVRLHHRRPPARGEPVDERVHHRALVTTISRV